MAAEGGFQGRRKSDGWVGLGEVLGWGGLRGMGRMEERDLRIGGGGFRGSVDHRRWFGFLSLWAC